MIKTYRFTAQLRSSATLTVVIDAFSDAEAKERMDEMRHNGGWITTYGLTDVTDNGIGRKV